MHPLVVETDRTLTRFSEEFSDSPFEWLYESDVQGTLAERLRTQLADHRATISAGLFGDAKAYGGSLEVEIGLVKTEYPGGTRFDIAVIDPDRISRRNPGDKSDPFWNQPVRVAIELKLCWIGYDPRDYVSDMRTDVEKIDAWRLEQGNGPLDGFAVLFIQEPKRLDDALRKDLDELCQNAQGPTHCWAIAPDDFHSATSESCT